MLALLMASAAVAAASSLTKGAAFVTSPATAKIRRPRRQILPSIIPLHLSNSGDDCESGAGISSSDDNTQEQLGSENNFYNDFEDAELSQSSSFIEQSSSSSTPPALSDSDSDPSLFQSLLKRQEQLKQSSQELLEKWTVGSAKTFAAFSINEQFYNDLEKGQQEGESFDWIRRIGIGTYPRVVCGSAHGSIYVADVESKQLLGIARGVHYSPSNSKYAESDGADAMYEKLRQYLFGDYDGGGVLAVAMSGNNNVVASSGREGGVKLFKFADGELKYVGDVPSLSRPLPGVRPVLVTCLKFDSLGRLFFGGQDGLLRMVTFDQDFASSLNDFDSNNGKEMMEVTVISSPKQLQQQSPSPILSLDISEELDMVATSHANGNVCIYSINPDDSTSSNNDNTGADSLLGVWNPFADTNNACHARSVTFISGGRKGDDDDDQKQENNNDLAWSVVVGGGNGMLWMQEIHPSYINDKSANTIVPSRTTTTSQSLFKENSMQPIEPSHQGPVLSLAARPGGILVSAAHDGMLRVTKIWPTPKPLYGLGGYKVWMGNICIDSEGKRLLSDGRDDVVVVHDFSKDAEEEQEEAY